MSYNRIVSRGRVPLSGADSCGSGQVWDPNAQYLGIKGQCMPRSNYSAAQLSTYDKTGALAATSSSPGWTEGFAKIFGALVAAPKAAPAAPIYVAPPSSGIPTTALIVGGIALAGVLFVVLKKD